MAVSILIGVVALFHLGFMVLEMFFWEKKLGLNIFHITPKWAAESAVLAKNQGVYNGFLASGLIWSFFISDLSFQEQVRLFFLSCTSIAGIYGAITTKKSSIFFIQALPSLIALGSVLLS